MDLLLTPIEVRILGCLIEKEATTPDVYPLTLNSLLTACNQKSSREPVMELTEDDIRPALVMRISFVESPRRSRHLAPSPAGALLVSTPEWSHSSMKSASLNQR